MNVRLIILLAIIALLATACGGGEEDSNRDTAGEVAATAEVAATTTSPEIGLTQEDIDEVSASTVEELELPEWLERDTVDDFLQDRLDEEEISDIESLNAFFGDLVEELDEYLTTVDQIVKEELSKLDTCVEDDDEVRDDAYEAIADLDLVDTSSRDIGEEIEGVVEDANDDCPDPTAVPTQTSVPTEAPTQTPMSSTATPTVASVPPTPQPLGCRKINEYPLVDTMDHVSTSGTHIHVQWWVPATGSPEMEAVLVATPENEGVFFVNGGGGLRGFVWEYDGCTTDEVEAQLDASVLRRLADKFNNIGRTDWTGYFTPGPKED